MMESIVPSCVHNEPGTLFVVWRRVPQVCSEACRPVPHVHNMEELHRRAEPSRPKNHPPLPSTVIASYLSLAPHRNFQT